MKDDNKPQTHPEHQEQHTVNTKGNKRRKSIAIAVCVVAMLAVLGVTTAYVLLWRDSASKDLLESLHNTTNMREMKFHATLTEPKTASGMVNTVTVDGSYKKGAGLSATAESTSTTNTIETIQYSRWVIDASGKVYSNLQSMDSKVINNNPSITQGIIDKMAIAMKTITNKNKDVWVKMTTKDVEYDNVYGVRSCVLGAFYKMQSQPESIQELVRQAIGSNGVTVKQTGGIYEIVPNTEKLDVLSNLYTNSQLYKKLTECDKTEYKATEEQIKEVLRKLTIEIKIDDTNKIISSIAFKITGGDSFALTILTTNNVTITVPKVAEPVVVNPSETPEQYMQRTSPYLYKNLMKMQEEIKKSQQQDQ